MGDYIKSEGSIPSFSEKDFSLNSFSPRDYRTLLTTNPNVKKLSDLLVGNHSIGKEIGSDNYMKNSDYRFLKTTNISKNYLLSENSIEYCKPEGKTFPKKNSILIAKDGGGDGLGEVCLYPYDNTKRRDCLSAGIININVNQEDLYYVLGVLKHKHFKNYVDINTAQGSTIRHAKLVSLDYEIAFPNNNNSKNPGLLKKYISYLVQNLIDKENQIIIKNKTIDKKIRDELNSESENTQSSLRTSISGIRETGRLDSGLYGPAVKDINKKIFNYSNGYWNIADNYNYSRGQNLQISQIGRSFYSKEKKKGFYRIFTNVEMQDDRTISQYKWIGNKNKLTLLPDKAVILSADGTVGRSFFYDTMPNTITNIHPWIIVPKEETTPIHKRVFLSLFLSFLKNEGYLEKIKDKSNGGGLKANHLDKWIRIPDFPDAIQKDIASEYYREMEPIKHSEINAYLDKELKRNKDIGIYQLNMEIMELKECINKLISKIINNEFVEMPF